jgi:acetyl-CoA synthetase
MEYVDADCPPEPLTVSTRSSSSTRADRRAKPKGILHTTGGYLLQAYTTCKYVFDLRDEDIYWCTADVGWVTGHSYVVYGPLAMGATSFMYEGAPNWPENDRFWKIIAEYAITVFYTAPTAIRRSSVGAING